MYSAFPLLLTLTSVVFALPTRYNQPRKAPLRRAEDIPGAEAVSPTAFIVALTPDSSVDPTNRVAWVTSVLSKNGIQTESLDTDSMQMNWNETVFNGFAGNFDDAALEALRSNPQVAYIEPGLYLFPFYLGFYSTWGLF